MRLTDITTISADSAKFPKETKNAPLESILKNIAVDYPALAGIGIKRETLRHFGVGYYGGKGGMRDKIVIPFHNADGLLVAYAGYSTKDGSIKYPKQFDRRLELYNYFRAENAGLFQDGVVLVTDPLNVMRFYELGIHRVVAIPTEKLYEPQLALIHGLVGHGGKVDFVPWTLEYTDNLQVLSQHFHVRLHRYYLGSEDEFLGQVVSVLEW